MRYARKRISQYFFLSILLFRIYEFSNMFSFLPFHFFIYQDENARNVRACFFFGFIFQFTSFSFLYLHGRWHLLNNNISKHELVVCASPSPLFSWNFHVSNNNSNSTNSIYHKWMSYLKIIACIPSKWSSYQIRHFLTSINVKYPILK